MKTQLASLLLLIASTAQAAPDDPTMPNPNDVPPNPDPTNPDPTKSEPIGEPLPRIPTTPADPVPAPEPVPATQPTTTTVVVNPVVQAPISGTEWYSRSRAGFGLTLGGGVEGFTDNTMRDTTKDGGNWNVRAIFGTRLPIGLEASYLGSMQSIDALGLDSNARLVGNGVQGDVRLNATTNTAVQPYLFGGVAWRRYSLSNVDINTSDIAASDDVLELPVGVGITYKTRGLMLDARGEFRGSFYDNLVPDSGTSSDSARMHRWGVNANVGYEF